MITIQFHYSFTYHQDDIAYHHDTFLLYYNVQYLKHFARKQSHSANFP